MALSDAWIDNERLWRDGQGLGAIREKWLARAAGLGSQVAVSVDGRVVRVTHLRVSPCDPALWEAYQERKAEFKAGLYAEVIDAYEDADEQETMSVKDIADEILDDGVDPYVSIHGGNKSRFIDWKLVRAEWELSRDDAKTVVSLLNAKVDVSE